MKLALYKGTRPGVPGLFNRLIRWWTNSPYSHCEIVFSDGISASSSIEDKGVRFKYIEMSPDKWDLIDLPNSDELYARNFFQQNLGKKYDILGLFGFIWRRGTNSKDKYFCSEICASSLQLNKPENYSPGSLADRYT
jgi:hypothetical protein